MSKTSSYHLSENDINKEKELISKAKINPTDFAPLYDYYFLPIFKYVIKRVQDEEQASELTAEIFAKALFKLDKFQFKGFPFSSWLYQIARNEIVDFYRENQASKYVQVSENELNYLIDSGEADLQTVMDKEEKINQILTCLKLLSDLEIELIEFKFFEDRSYKEIAEIIDTTEINARVKTHRALAKLKDLIKN